MSNICVLHLFKVSHLIQTFDVDYFYNKYVYVAFDWPVRRGGSVQVAIIPQIHYVGL